MSNPFRARDIVEPLTHLTPEVGCLNDAIMRLYTCLVDCAQRTDDPKADAMRSIAATFHTFPSRIDLLADRGEAQPLIMFLSQVNDTCYATIDLQLDAGNAAWRFGGSEHVQSVLDCLKNLRLSLI